MRVGSAVSLSRYTSRQTRRWPTGSILTGGPPFYSKWRQVESRFSRRDKLRLQLADRARELESMPRARARDQDLRVEWMEVDDEVVIRRVGEQAHTALTYRRLRKLR